MNYLKKIVKPNMIILTLLLSNSSYCQFFYFDNSILKDYRISIITELICIQDSVITDTIKKMYFYNTNGLLTKKINICSDSTLNNCFTVKYVYNDKGNMIDSVFFNLPFLESDNYSNIVDSSLLILYDSGKISSVNKKWRDGNYEKINYYYGVYTSKNDSSIVSFSGEYFYKNFVDYEYIVKKDASLCLKDKSGNIYRYEPNLLDFITLYSNTSNKKIIYKYEFYTN